MSAGATPIDDIDIFRAAALLIKERGDEAAIHADMEFDNMVERGDIEGAAVWLRIAKAIHDMQRETPRPGEQQH